MLRFEHIEFIYALLLLIPIAILFFVFQKWRNRTIAKIGNKELIYQLLPEFSKGKQYTKFLVCSLAFTALLFALANPQMGTRQEKVKRSGIDLMIALDVSKSMLAEDVQPNRLAKAKYFIQNFIDELKGDRIGLIIFAGRAYLQMPMTVDYSASKMYLRTVSTDMVPTQGTAIGDAVNLAINSLDNSSQKSKALVVISDGEDNEEGAEEAVKEAAKNGIRVFTIGVGTDKGAPIPLPNGDFKRNADGEIVLTKTNQEELDKLAALGNGKFMMLQNGKAEVQNILKAMSGIEKKDFEEMVFTDYENWFQYPLLSAILLIALNFVLSERKSKLWEKLKI